MYVPQGNTKHCPLTNTSGTPFAFSAVSPAVGVLFSRKRLSTGLIFPFGPWDCSSLAAGQVQGTEASREAEEQFRDPRAGWAARRHGFDASKAGWWRAQTLGFPLHCSHVMVQKIFNLPETISSSLHGDCCKVTVRVIWRIHVKSQHKPW